MSILPAYVKAALIPLIKKYRSGDALHLNGEHFFIIISCLLSGPCPDGGIEIFKALQYAKVFKAGDKGFSTACVKICSALFNKGKYREAFSLWEQGLRNGEGLAFLELLNDWKLCISSDQERKEILRLFLLATRSKGLPDNACRSLKNVIAIELERELMDVPGYLYNNLASIGRWLLTMSEQQSSCTPVCMPLLDTKDPANNETLDVIGKYDFVEEVIKKNYQSALIEELLSKGTRAQCYAFILLCENSFDIPKIISTFPSPDHQRRR